MKASSARPTGMRATDIVMNVEGAAVEQELSRTIMPLFHALFSLGTVAGAGAVAGTVAGTADVARGRPRNLGVSWENAMQANAERDLSLA